MSGLPSMAGVGRLTAAPELRFTGGGMAICMVALAFNSRKLNRDTNQWEDADVFYVRGTAFKQLAENAAECLMKGMEVHVSGRLKTEQWADKQSGDKRSVTSLLLDSIGPNLAFATATVQKTTRLGGSSAHGLSDTGQGGPADDPWGSAPASASPAASNTEPPF